jgi:AraC-like DNA-binding protein
MGTEGRRDGRNAAAGPVAAFAAHVVRRQAVAQATHRHALHFLGLRVRGRGQYRLGPQTLPQAGPFASYLAPGELDQGSLEAGAESWIVGFTWPDARVTPRRDGVAVAWAGQRLWLPRWKPLDGAALAEQVELYARLRDALERADALAELEARASLLEVLLAYARLPDPGATAIGDRAVARFRELLREHACGALSLRALAKRAGASPQHLRERFRAVYGTTPLRFRTRLRLARARTLLTTSGLGVAAAARAVGYDDPLYFSRVFRRAFGFPAVDLVRRFRVGGDG